MSDHTLGIYGDPEGFGVVIICIDGQKYIVNTSEYINQMSFMKCSKLLNEINDQVHISNININAEFQLENGLRKVRDSYYFNFSYKNLNIGSGMIEIKALLNDGFLEIKCRKLAEELKSYNPKDTEKVSYRVFALMIGLAQITEHLWPWGD